MSHGETEAFCLLAVRALTPWWLSSTVSATDSKVQRIQTHIDGCGFLNTASIIPSHSPIKVGAASCEVLWWCAVPGGDVVANGVRL